MIKKIFKAFMVYSYITLVAYVGSENFLNICEANKEKREGTGDGRLKLDWIWKLTINNFKEGWKM